jgi:predicted AlkP superfamily pyrophosphatase or phosphodiesterase
MNKTVVIDVVGLSSSLIGEHTPFLKSYIQKKNLRTIEPMLPAVTTSVQSTYLTGQWPATNGIVGNGWYDREDCEIKFWKQSNNLVQGEKIWDAAKKIDPTFTCAKMFWWYNRGQIILPMAESSPIAILILQTCGICCSLSWDSFLYFSFGALVRISNPLNGSPMHL